MKDPTEFLMTLTSKISELKAKYRESSWSFRQGLKLFIDPTVRCPWCEQWIHTRRVWLVDDKWAVLKGCWFLNGEPVDKEKFIIHPHVCNADKSICLGTTSIPSTALFASITSGHHYYSTEHWFEQLGHNCPNTPKTICNVCNRMYFHDEGYSLSYGQNNYRVCSIDCFNVANLFRCTTCFSERELYEPQDRDKLCEQCWINNTVECSFCTNRDYSWRIHRTPDIEFVCQRCHPDHFKKCSNCLCFLHNSEIMEDGICRYCEYEIEEDDREEFIRCLVYSCQEQAMAPGDYCLNHSYPCRRCDDFRVAEENTLCNTCLEADNE